MKVPFCSEVTNSQSLKFYPSFHAQGHQDNMSNAGQIYDYFVPGYYNNLIEQAHIHDTR